MTAYYVEAVRGVGSFLSALRNDLKTGEFRPVPARERMIPKAGGKKRRLGIPTVRDRVVQAALKLVLEPIFEAGFQPCSYGFRPKRRAQDAIAEIHYYGSRGYEWVVEGDIEACFDTIDHMALMGWVRRRVGDKRVGRLVKAFLKAGILSEDLVVRQTDTGTPQGGILSPLLANIALSVLDDYFMESWQVTGTSKRRATHRAKGGATWRLVRYADDFVIMISGVQEHAAELKARVARILEDVGLRLSSEKTTIVHVDDGFDFLGFRIQRKRKRGSGKHYIYTWPSKKSVDSIKAKVRVATRQGRNQPLLTLLKRLDPILRGWTMYFRHGVSKATFGYLRGYVITRVIRWLRRKHNKAGWKNLRRRYFRHGWWPTQAGFTPFNPGMAPVTRYRYRGVRIPTPWTERTHMIAA